MPDKYTRTLIGRAIHRKISIRDIPQETYELLDRVNARYSSSSASINITSRESELDDLIETVKSDSDIGRLVSSGSLVGSIHHLVENIFIDGASSPLIGVSLCLGEDGGLFIYDYKSHNIPKEVPATSKTIAKYAPKFTAGDLRNVIVKKTNKNNFIEYNIDFDSDYYLSFRELLANWLFGPKKTTGHQTA